MSKAGSSVIPGKGHCALSREADLDRLTALVDAVARLAHEMNTPLGVANTAGANIAGIVDRLGQPMADEDRTDLLADLRENATLLQRNLRRAHDLTVSLTRAAVAQADSTLNRTDLGQLVQDCAALMSPSLRQRRITVTLHLEPGTPLPWRGYADRLIQVFVNLFQNVVRYAYPQGGGTVDIRIARVSLLEGPGYRIEFEDYGQGIGADILPRLFEPYVTSAPDQGGTGLGLAIVRTVVVDNLRGRIDCTSSPGKGARFTLTLPQDLNDREAP